MKPIIFRTKAERDLLGIVDYFSEFSDETVQNVLSDIYQSIDQLAYFPKLGRPVDGENFRRIVTLKYHFTIGYEVTPDSVSIVGIFRYQDREV